MADDSAALRQGIPQIGDVIADKYRIENIVGTGGMGVVVSARHLQLGQTVAIKILAVPEEYESAEATTRFLREAQAAARLLSDHVVRIYDVGMADDVLPYMVMELLRGSDLGAILDERGKLPVKEAVDYVLQACDAIAEAHRVGIVHRDLKPSNLFITRRSDGAPLLKVLDFGISKSLTRGDTPGGMDGTLTSTRSVMGSPYYMSPEQVRDARRVDGRADIWALGVILHELITGEPAFQADTFPGVCAAIVADPPIGIRSRRPDVPTELEAIAMRCLQKNPDARFQTVEELMEALWAFSSRSEQPLPDYVSTRGFLSAANDGSLSSEVHTPIETQPYSSDSPKAAANRAAARSRAADPARASFEEQPTLSSPGSSSGSSPESSTGRSARPVTGNTKTQMSADLLTAPTPESAKFNKRLTGMIAVGLAVIGAGWGVFAYSEESVAPEPVVASALPEAKVLEAPEFTLVIESTPPGAQVFLGSQQVGQTPFSTKLSIPTSAAPKVFTLRKEGFEPYELEQGPSEGTVRIHADLTAIVVEPPPSASATSEPVAKPVVRRAPARAPKQTTPARPSASTPRPDDIRLER